MARTIEEIPELFESATREAIAAFGRGECFVERYLDKPRHVETQVPRRPARQRRRRLHPRLLAAAPPPEAGRGGAGAVPDRRAAQASSTSPPRRSARRPATTAPAPCEFLVGQDGTISFLEVNTRLQVEHPVTEEITGIDLVREQFRIADGEKLGLTRTRRRAGTRSSSGSTARTPAATSCPPPARSASSHPPTGPGVRLDSGVETGSVIGGQFDSMLAKLIVTGADREQALERVRGARWPSSRSRAWPP